MLNRIYKLKSIFKPGSQTIYSNTNYVLLGFIIEDASGVSYADNLQQCNRIGLKDTYLSSELQVDKGEAKSYYFNDEKRHPSGETDMSIPQGAGAITSTTSDLILFINKLYQTNELIQEGSKVQMIPTDNPLGLGMMRFPFNNQWTYGHSGGIDCFVSIVGYFPDNKLSISVLSNGVNMHHNDMLIALITIANGQDFELPNYDQNPISLNAIDLQAYVGDFESKDIELKIKFFIKKKSLFAQATGQQPFPLTAFSQKEFRYESSGIRFIFDEKEDGSINYNQCTLHQGGGIYRYVKMCNM